MGGPERSSRDTERISDPQRARQSLNDGVAALNDTRIALNDTHTTLKDTKEALKDTKEALKDTKESLKDAKESLKDTKEALKDTKESLKDAKEALKDTKESLNDRKEALNDTHSALNDRKEALNDLHTPAPDHTPALHDTHRMIPARRSLAKRECCNSLINTLRAYALRPCTVVSLWAFVAGVCTTPLHGGFTVGFRCGRMQYAPTHCNASICNAWTLDMMTHSHMELTSGK